MALFLFLGPGTGLAQPRLPSCAEGPQNATVLIPDTVSLPLSFSPSTIAVISPEGTCAGKASRSGTTPLAVARRDSLGGGGLENGERLRFRIYSASNVVDARGSFVACGDLPSSITSICRDDGIYEEGAVYVLEGLDSGERRESDSVAVKSKTPVRRLKGTVEHGRVALRWEVSGPVNAVRFVVQRKTLQSNPWDKVGVVDTTRTTSFSTSYRFTDSRLPTEADSLVYRLKHVGPTGTLGYSPEVTVARPVEHVQVRRPYPNPAHSVSTFRYAVPGPRDVTISLYDILGRHVRTVVDETKKGRQEVKIDVSDLPSGTYFLRMDAGRTVKTERLTLIR